jgi:hypothetical protein
MGVATSAKRVHTKAALQPTGGRRMAEDLIPEDVREFVIKHIDSITHLEALLLLRGNPDEYWTANSTAGRLYISEHETAIVLARLCSLGFLATEDQVFRYACRDSELENMVARLETLYARHLIPVTNLIHTKPSRIREFADAFKLRKDS